MPDFKENLRNYVALLFFSLSSKIVLHVAFYNKSLFLKGVTCIIIIVTKQKNNCTFIRRLQDLMLKSMVILTISTFKSKKTKALRVNHEE